MGRFDDVETSAEALLAAAQGRTIPPRPYTPPPPHPVEVYRREMKAKNRPGSMMPRQRRHGRKLAYTEMTGKVIKLRLAGRTQREIGEELGIHPQTVARHIDIWLAERLPGPKQTDKLRELMLDRLEGLHSKHWHKAMGLDKDGNPTAEGPSKEAGEFVLKLMDRQAKLMGVDLQPNTTTLMISAESIAQFLGWDDAAPDPFNVIDVAESPRELQSGDE